MNNRKIMILVAIVLSLIWSTNLFALSDAAAEAGGKALLGVAFAIQLLILGGIIFLIKFLYKKIFKSKEEK